MTTPEPRYNVSHYPSHKDGLPSYRVFDIVRGEWIAYCESQKDAQAIARAMNVQSGKS